MSKLNCGVVFCLVLLVFASESDAQRRLFRSRIFSRPSGNVVAQVQKAQVQSPPVTETAAELQTPPSNSPSTGLATEPHGEVGPTPAQSASDKPTLKVYVNKPDVPHHCDNCKVRLEDCHCPPGKPVCKPRDNKLVSDHLRTATGKDIPVYVKCIKVRARIDVPHLVTKKVNTLNIGLWTYKVDCCKVTVCVPVENCVTKLTNCELRKSEETLEICIKPNGKVDVYAREVPGMPVDWVILKDVTLAEVNQNLGTNVSL